MVVCDDWADIFSVKKYSKLFSASSDECDCVINITASHLWLLVNANKVKICVCETATQSNVIPFFYKVETNQIDSSNVWSAAACFSLMFGGIVFLIRSIL